MTTDDIPIIEERLLQKYIKLHFACLFRLIDLMEKSFEATGEAFLQGPFPEFCDEAVWANIVTETANYSVFAGNSKVHFHHLYKHKH